MLNEDVKFQVNIKDIVLDVNEMAELVAFVRGKQFMYKDYVGKERGFNNTEYDYKLVKCDEKSRIDIQPVNETIWLYLNTFGKDDK